MRVSSVLRFVVAGLTGLAAALPQGDSSPKDRRYAEKRDDIDYTVFEHAATASKLSYVTNSGICETTPGVNQYSGYLSVGGCSLNPGTYWGAYACFIWLFTDAGQAPT